MLPYFYLDSDSDASSTYSHSCAHTSPFSIGWMRDSLLLQPPSLPESSQQVDEQIRRYLEQARVLREQRNSLYSSTRRLPLEVLTTIFEFAANAQLRLAWINVTHVCRLWRTLALNTPWLWGNLYPMPLRWAEAMIERSKDSPLRVKNVRWNILQTVLRFPDRIKELDIEVFYHQESYRLMSTLDHPPASLETLSLTGAIPFPPEFIHKPMPCLRHVRLVVHDVPLHAAWLSNLQSLTLAGFWKASSDTGRSIVDDLLVVLERSPGLKHLSLIFPASAHQFTLPSSGEHRIHLPLLQDITLGVLLGQTSWFKFVDFISPGAIRTMEIDWLDVVDENTIESLESLCTFFSTNSRPTLAQKLVVEGSSIRLYKDADEDPSTSTTPPLLSFHGLKITSLDLCTSFCQHLPLGALRSLHIRGKWNFRGAEFFLQDFARLEELHIHETHIFTRFLQTIGQSLVNVPKPYPALRRIQLVDVSFKPKAKTVATLKRWITARKKLGVPIQELCLICCGVSSSNVKALSKSINVVWDGVDRS